jgi:predicted nucleotidyltransferase
MPEEVRKIQEKIVPLLKQHGIKKAAVFGSVARGDARPDSDVDVVIEISRPYGLFEFIAIKHGIEDILDKKVDLVEYASIKPRVKENIIKDQVQIL